MTTEPAVTRRRRRAPWWIAGAVVCTLAVTGAGVAAASANGTQADANNKAQQKKTATAEVVRGTLSGSKKASGTLDYVEPRDLASSVSGILTALPAPGSTIGLGGSLFTVDNVNVYLFHGILPAWRPFDAEMENGPDVKQLEQSLRDLGFFTREPDDVFDWRTRQAIIGWQKATGQEQTGRIELGRIVFAPSDLRIAGLKAAVGDNVGGGPVITVSGLTKQVKVELKLADQTLAVVGGKVQIELPGGATTAGTITAVGQPQEKEANGQTSVVIPVVIALDDPAAVDALQRANVTVDIPSETRADVLYVPLGALLALEGGGFGVEVVESNGRTKQVPVKTGLFAGGNVEISGDGVKEGARVVVPAL
jgi:membrane fusion protein (multidrug efflux system)